MRVAFRVMVALAFVTPSGVTCGAAATGGCEAQAVLERAAQLYREARRQAEIVRYEVRVPGAPPHSEQAEFGFGADGGTYVRMPQGYLVVFRDGHLFGLSGARTDAYVVRSLSRGLQGAVDEAFEGTGPPLVPVPILLREASSPSDRIQAFASKLLAPLVVAGCTQYGDRGALATSRVELRAATGTVWAEFDATGRLQRFSLRVLPAPGQAPIEADARFERVARRDFPLLPEPAVGATAVARFADIDRPVATARASLSGVVLPTIEGAPTRLDPQPGRVLVLEFWASWCAPCRVSMPAIEEFARWARDSKLAVEVFAVDTLERFHDAAEARARLAPYLAARPVGLPVLLDLDATLHARLGSGFPLTVVVDTSGRVAATHSGLDPGLADKLRAEVPPLLTHLPQP